MTPLIPLAANFLAGGLLTLLIPGPTLIVIAIWYTRSVLRREREREREL